MVTGPFILTEQQIALRLGVSTAWVRDHRGTEGDEWRKDQGRFVWSEAGAARLADLVEKSARPPGSPEDGPEGKSAPVTHPEPQTHLSAAAGAASGENDAPVTLKVARGGFANRRVLLATLPDGSSCTVWVTDSRRFATEIPILARPWPGRPGVYTFAGNPENPAAGPREPRRPGVW